MLDVYFLSYSTVPLVSRMMSILKSAESKVSQKVFQSSGKITPSFYFCLW